MSYCSLSLLWPSQLSSPAAGVGAVEELHEAHAALDQPPGQDAVAGEGGLDRVRRIIGAVQLQNVRRLRATDR